MLYAPNKILKDYVDPDRLYIAYANASQPAVSVVDKPSRQRMGYYPNLANGANSVRTTPSGYVIMHPAGTDELRVFNKYDQLNVETIITVPNLAGSGVWTVGLDDSIYYFDSTAGIRKLAIDGTPDWTWTRPSGFTPRTLDVDSNDLLWVGGGSIAGVRNLYQLTSAGVENLSYELVTGPYNDVVSIGFTESGLRSVLIENAISPICQIWKITGGPSLLLDVLATYGSRAINITASDQFIYFGTNGKGFAYDWNGTLVFSSNDATTFGQTPVLRVDTRDESGNDYVYVYNRGTATISKRNFGLGNSGAITPLTTMIDTNLEGAYPIAPTWYPA